MTYSINSLNKHLFGLGIILAIAFGIQFSMNPTASNLNENMLANWNHSPKSLEEADELANQVVVGRVIDVQKGEDLVVKQENEPSGEMRIPTEVITISVDNTLKGKPESIIKLFRTGTSHYTAERQEIPEKYRGKTGKGTPVQFKPVLLEGDPEYIIGDRQLIFLTDGPFGLKRVVAPEGRFKIDETDALVPVENRGLSKKLRGVTLSDFHGKYEKLKAIKNNRSFNKLKEFK